MALYTMQLPTNYIQTQEAHPNTDPNKKTAHAKNEISYLKI